MSPEWGNGNPAGTLEEVASSSAIAIESKNGNSIKKNANEGNPTVHVSQDGNGVVNRASGLEREGNGGNNDDGGNEGGGDKKEPETGEKRGRGDADGGLETAPEEERESAEKAEGRGAKKPKTGEGEDAGTKNDSIKVGGNGDKKDDKLEAGEGEPAAKGVEREEQKAPKKRGPGRPKKSESKVEKTAALVRETNNSDSIGKRTRSKA